MKPLSQTQNWLIMAVTALVLSLLSWFSITTLTFFTTDNGLRFLQIQALIDNNWQSFALDYVYQPIDPEFRYVPYYGAYLVIQEQLYVSVTPFFPLLTSWAYALLGPTGLMILPLGGGLVTAWSVYRLGQLAELPRPVLLFVGTLFATPFGFYTLELWDHTLGSACALLGLYGVAYALINHSWRAAMLGGIALALGSGQRPELYVFSLAVGLSMLIVCRPALRLKLAGATIGGGIIGIVPLWSLQYWWFGHFLAPVVARRRALFNYGNLDEYLFRGRDNLGLLAERGRFIAMIEPRHLTTFFATLSIAIGLILLIMVFRQPRWRNRKTLFGLTALMSMGYLVFIEIAWGETVSGLLPTFPLLAFSLTYLPPNHPKKRPLYHLLFLTTLLFFGLIFLLWPAYGGKQWGVRYMLPLYPMLIYLAWQTYHTLQAEFRPALQTPLRRIFWTLCGLSILLQLLGMRVLFIYHYIQTESLQTLHQLPATHILTNHPYLATSMAAADKDFIYLGHNQELLEEMLLRLAEQDVTTFSVISHPGMPLHVPPQLGPYRTQKLGPLHYQFEPAADAP